MPLPYLCCRDLATPDLPRRMRWANLYYTRIQYLIALLVTICFYVALGLSAWDMDLKLSAQECKESREPVDYLYVFRFSWTEELPRRICFD